MNKVFLLLGSNLGDRLNNLIRTMELLHQNFGTIIKKSSIYETEPWGTDNPLPYLNMVVMLENNLSPEKTLENIFKVERMLGRVRSTEINMPRTIDIDILLFNDEVINTTDLKIPHERMHLRKFVLVPLVELNPNIVHPILKKTVLELLEICNDSSWVKYYNS